MVEELKAKVLLVDDEEDFLATLSERLIVRGHHYRHDLFDEKAAQPSNVST